MTHANAVVNGVATCVRASTTPVEDVVGTFDVVLANIGAGVLRELATVLAARLAPGGRLVLAGLLVEQVDAVLDAYPGCTEVGRACADGWVATVLRRCTQSPTQPASTSTPTSIRRAVVKRSG